VIDTAIEKPFSQACENNKAPILAILKDLLQTPGQLLEIGSGTGQHGAFMAGELPHVQWHYSDRAVNLPGIRLWQAEAQLANLLGPLELDVTQDAWPIDHVDAVFSANTAHIMAWPMVEAMFQGIARCLSQDGVFCLYGPFNYQGRFTSESNARFDQWLKERHPAQGIRDFEAVVALAESLGLQFESDHAMPANNRLLVWRQA